MKFMKQGSIKKQNETKKNNVLMLHFLATDFITHEIAVLSIALKVVKISGLTPCSIQKVKSSRSLRGDIISSFNLHATWT